MDFCPMWIAIIALGWDTIQVPRFWFNITILLFSVHVHIIVYMYYLANCLPSYLYHCKSIIDFSENALFSSFDIAYLHVLPPTFLGKFLTDISNISTVLKMTFNNDLASYLLSEQVHLLITMYTHNTVKICEKCEHMSRHWQYILQYYYRYIVMLISR